VNDASVIVGVDRQMLDALKALARAEGVTIGDLLRQAISGYLGGRIPATDRKPVDSKPATRENPD